MGMLIGSFQWQGTEQPVLDWPQTRRNFHVDCSWQSDDGRCWLAQTRPLIQDRCEAQDLSDDCAQPITSHCGRFTLVFNGKIVNHQQVRHGLRFQGWRSNSDGETLVEGLAQRGPAIVLELRGMFAFAAYDREKEQLLLARDRLGIKRLYLCWQANGIGFSSERRALPGADQLEAQTISQVLAFGHDSTPARFPAPGTSGSIVSLPAGMVVRVNHSRPHDPVRYWPPQPRPDWTPLPIHSGRWARTFLRQQLEEVVAQHLCADLPVACLLSSGPDSAILASLASRLQPRGTTTFTVALQGAPEGENRQLRSLELFCGSQHHELVIQENDALAWLEQGLASLDVPLATGLNTFLLCRAVAAQGIKVALSGLGADELFGGDVHRLMRWLRPLRWLPARLRQRLLRGLTPRLAAKLSNLPTWDRWHLALALHRWASDDDLVAAGAEPLDWPESPPQRITQAWGQTSWAELFGTIEPMLLRDADGMSMACGLELRMPFLDHRLVEIALRMPERFQCLGKSLLRQACADLLPTGYLEQPRQGCGLAMAVWMHGPLRDLCRSRIEALEHSGWLDPLWIQHQWHTFEVGQLKWPQAWSLVVLGEFASRELK